MQSPVDLLSSSGTVVAANLSAPLTLARSEALAGGRPAKQTLEEYVAGEVLKMNTEKTRICQAVDSLIPLLKVHGSLHSFRV